MLIGRNAKIGLVGFIGACGLALILYVLIPEPAKEVPLSGKLEPSNPTSGSKTFAPPLNTSEAADITTSLQQTRSLQGTAVDGGVRWNERGRLQPDLALRRLFDYFLVLLGEESEQQIRQRLRHYVEQQAIAAGLDDGAVEQVMAQYEAYVRYKMALEQAGDHDGSIAGATAAVKRQWQIAQAELGPELADAFFAQDQAFNQVALDYLALVRQGESDPERLQQAMTSLLLEQPGALASEILASSAPGLVQSKVEQLQQAGATEAEIWQLRQQVLGQEAANRLAQLDKKRQRWNARYQDYLDQKQQIQSADLSPQDQRSAIEQLRLNLFSPTEARRVEALDPR